MPLQVIRARAVLTRLALRQQLRISKRVSASDKKVRICSPLGQIASLVLPNDFEHAVKILPDLLRIHTGPTVLWNSAEPLVFRLRPPQHEFLEKALLQQTSVWGRIREGRLDFRFPQSNQTVAQGLRATGLLLLLAVGGVTFQKLFDVLKQPLDLALPA